MDEPANGTRYVTHQRLADVIDAHRRDEEARREQLAERLVAAIERRARLTDMERLTETVASQGVVQDAHESRWQRMEGMVSLARFALGTSIVSSIAAIVAIVVALR